MVQTPARQTYSLPSAAAAANHGRTPAAWALVLGACAGVLVVGLGLMLALDWLSWTGVALVALAVVVSAVLRGMGLGQPATGRGQADGRDWYSD